MNRALFKRFIFNLSRILLLCLPMHPHLPIFPEDDTPTILQPLIHAKPTALNVHRGARG